MHRCLLLTVTALALLACPALAGGPYDGTYEGGAGRDCYLPPTRVTLTVANGIVSGTSAWGSGSVAVRGKVDADGTFHGTIGGGPLSGKFEDGKFEAIYRSSGGGSSTNSQGCKREMRLERKG